MKLAVNKNHLGGQSLYRSLDPSKKTALYFQFFRWKSPTGGLFSSCSLLSEFVLVLLFLILSPPPSTCIVCGLGAFGVALFRLSGDFVSLLIGGVIGISNDVGFFGGVGNQSWKNGASRTNVCPKFRFLTIFSIFLNQIFDFRQ